jgi:hypothetical protein
VFKLSSERDQLWVTDDGLSSDGQQFHAYLHDLISVPLEKYCLSLIGQLHNVILLRIRELTGTTITAINGRQSWVIDDVFKLSFDNNFISFNIIKCHEIVPVVYG